jgi:hypothetical protein
MLVDSLRARIARRLSVAFAASAMIAFGAAEPAMRSGIPMFGGPWISIETPANPFDNSTRNAIMLVHTFHHGTAEFMPVVGKAEGIVDGQRRTTEFSLDKSSRDGTYGVQRQWGTKGIWTLLITATPPEHGGSSSIQAVVEIAANGEIGRVTVPRDAQSRPRLMTTSEVDAALRERARSSVAVGAR